MNIIKKLTIFVLGICLFTNSGASDIANREAANGVTLVEIATLPHEREVLSSLHSVNSDVVEAAVAFPDNFNPQQLYPVLITQVTADRYLPNIDAMEAYRETALKIGYVVLTAQAKPWPATTRDDTRQHRYISLRAALRWLGQEYPASRNWPLVLAGFSGGAKMVQPLAAVMLMEQRDVIGLFLGGCNDESTNEILRVYPEVADAYKNIPFFLSSGRNDRVASPRAMRRIAKRMEKAGAKRVHLSRYSGAHYLEPRELDAALKWFLQGGHKVSPLQTGAAGPENGK